MGFLQGGHGRPARVSTKAIIYTSITTLEITTERTRMQISALGIVPNILAQRKKMIRVPH